MSSKKNHLALPMMPTTPWAQSKVALSSNQGSRLLHLRQQENAHRCLDASLPESSKKKQPARLETSASTLSMYMLTLRERRGSNKQSLRKECAVQPRSVSEGKTKTT